MHLDTHSIYPGVTIVKPHFIGMIGFYRGMYIGPCPLFQDEQSTMTFEEKQRMLTVHLLNEISYRRMIESIKSTKAQLIWDY